MEQCQKSEENNNKIKIFNGIIAEMCFASIPSIGMFGTGVEPEYTAAVRCVAP